jgi:hypothetical protein
MVQVRILAAELLVSAGVAVLPLVIERQAWGRSVLEELRIPRVRSGIGANVGPPRVLTPRPAARLVQ